ncbi:hypothetical protein [Hyphomonas oceanitis]|uniref:hypothetical protein n=1 Tax=Hyphomonas oceanitis TaxID=81033 RepID=UPI003002D240
MTISKIRLRQSWFELLNQETPFAATTIQFNRNLSRISNDRAHVDRNVQWVKQELSAVAFLLDKIYFNTSHVEDRVSKTDRFEAICVVEKAGVNPHVHILWFLGKGRCEPWETLNRRIFLLRLLNSPGIPLEDRDAKLLDGPAGKKATPPSSELIDWQRKGWSAVTKSIYSDGWSNYITKEQGYVEDFSNRVFWLSDFHEAGQRIAPTRFYTVDKHTGARHLNLDAPLIPRR